jgi:hypothetical protein
MAGIRESQNRGNDNGTPKPPSPGSEREVRPLEAEPKETHDPRS